MTQSMRPYRSVLYIPGSKERALEKARGLSADAIIFDLEDAVAPDAKATPAATLRAELDKGGYGHRAKLVRINGFDSAWGQADIQAFRGADIDGLLLPKVNSAPRYRDAGRVAAGRADLGDDGNRAGRA